MWFYQNKLTLWCVEFHLQSRYHNFKNKEEIAYALYKLCITDFRKALEKSLEQPQCELIVLSPH